MFRDVNVIDTGIGQCAKNDLCVAFASRPFVLKIVDLALGNAHANRSLPGGLFHLGDDIERKAQALVDIAAPLVGSLIGVIGQKLIQQIAVCAMNLDAVKPCCTNSPSRGAGEPVDGLGDVLVTHRPWHPIAALAVIERHLFTFWANGRRASGFVDEAIGLTERPRVHDLRNHRTAMTMNRIGGGAPCQGLLVVDETRLERVSLGKAAIGIAALGDNQTESAFGKSLVVPSHGLCCAALLCCADSGHGRECEPVLQFQISHIEQRWNVFVYLAHTSKTSPCR